MLPWTTIVESEARGRPAPGGMSLGMELGPVAFPPVLGLARACTLLLPLFAITAVCMCKIPDDNRELGGWLTGGKSPSIVDVGTT